MASFQIISLYIATQCSERTLIALVSERPFERALEPLLQVFHPKKSYWSSRPASNPGTCDVPGTPIFGFSAVDPVVRRGRSRAKKRGLGICLSLPGSRLRAYF